MKPGNSSFFSKARAKIASALKPNQPSPEIPTEMQSIWSGVTALDASIVARRAGHADAVACFRMLPRWGLPAKSVSRWLRAASLQEPRARGAGEVILMEDENNRTANCGTERIRI
jgi:hypothetical protein